MSEIKGKEYTLAKIFSSDFDYEMPGFQRPYAWTHEEAGALFDDLYDFWLDSEGQYFLGSIVLVKEENHSHSLVIDGQQRLATLTILFAALSEYAPAGVDFMKYINEPGDELEGRTSKPRLTVRKKDKKFFRYYIQSGKISELSDLKEENCDTEAKINIKRNAVLLLKKVCDKLNTPDKIKSFGQFLVKRCCIVAVSTSTTESAFKIFSVMNSRGMDLLVTDILKSDIIGKIDNEQEQEEYTQTWEDTENNLTRPGFNDLFAAIRMIKIKAKAQATLKEEFSRKILPDISDSTAKKFIDDVLVPYSEAYSFVRDSENDEHLKWLNMLDNSDWVPPAMLMMYYINENHSNVSVNEFLGKLERLASCMFALSYDVNKRIERYSKILTEIEKSGGTSYGGSIELSDSEKKDFLIFLDSDIYKEQKKRKYFVLRLDSFMQGGGATYNHKIFTLEHVLPQTVSPSSQWAQTWPDENERDNLRNKIGNLIPLEKRANSRARNYDFDDKKRIYFTSKNNTASYVLASNVISEAEWTPAIVRKRQAKLMKIYRDNWNLN